MSDQNTSKKIDNMTDEEVMEALVGESARIINHMLDDAPELEPLQMTDAEIWESLIPPFQD